MGARDSKLEQSPDVLSAVPVFPLPRLVLFPGTRLPLHIFEPRYRDMVRDCLDRDDPLMAVVQLRPGFEADYAGRPPIHGVGGVGRIVAQRRNPDGTYDLVLEAMARVSVQELPADGLAYRRGDLAWLEDSWPQAGLNGGELRALLTLANRITTILQEAQPAFDLLLDPELEPGMMADHIADQLVLDPAARQHVLECLDVGARIRLVVDHLARLHLALDGHFGSGPTLH